VPGPRRIYETFVHGDIIVRTDGGEYRGGVLYDVEFESPGCFADDMGAETMALGDAQRTTGHHAACQ
jgi:hypothetical protein